VSGVIADVRVTQVYRNEGAQPIEAKYLFPASTRAAVYAMRMRVGDRVIEAQIREKQTARREYETAKREGKSASLLEQQRPNVFQMSIAHVMPGDEIAVDLRYTETVIRSTASTGSC
jgi:Ca-activated chloride channel family protein